MTDKEVSLYQQFLQWGYKNRLSFSFFEMYVHACQFHITNNCLLNIMRDTRISTFRRNLKDRRFYKDLSQHAIFVYLCLIIPWKTIPNIQFCVLNKTDTNTTFNGFFFQLSKKSLSQFLFDRCLCTHQYAHGIVDSNTSTVCMMDGVLSDPWSVGHSFNIFTHVEVNWIGT